MWWDCAKLGSEIGRYGGGWGIARGVGRFDLEFWKSGWDGVGVAELGLGSTSEGGSGVWVGFWKGRVNWWRYSRGLRFEINET